MYNLRLFKRMKVHLKKKKKILWKKYYAYSP
jgi:hypothetical protein